MKTEIVPADSPLAIERALEILQMGGLIAFPTDTVYGVGALAFDGKAVESIYAAKDRPIEKAIPILIGDAEDIHKVASGVPLIAEKLANQFWPGPLTIVLPKRSDLPEAVSATNTVGVRVPDHAVARRVLRAAGPMAVTSANISGRPSPSTAQEVFEQLNSRIALIVDGGKTPGGVPSTVVDCTGTKPVVLREGPISLNDILAKTGQ
jgi:L-threonylcarbamoyladenylate synthase